MGIFADQLSSLQRDDWERLGLTVAMQEITRVLSSDDIKMTGNVSITTKGNGTESPLTVNNYSQAPIAIKVNEGSFSLGAQNIGGFNGGDSTFVFPGLPNGSTPATPTPQGASPITGGQPTQPNTKQLGFLIRATITAVDSDTIMVSVSSIRMPGSRWRM